ncbi:MAG: Na+/H+ antiporter subunit E [Phycisphaeraceae bacterium]
MTKMLLLNLFLALVYVALTGDISGMNFLIGFGLGFLVVTVFCRAVGTPSYPRKYFRLLSFGLYFLRILIMANLQVAWEIITPSLNIRPRIIRYPVHELTPVQITTLANAISLTPGTLTCDVDDDGEHLYIHAMYGEDREATVRSLDELKDRLMAEVFSP